MATPKSISIARRRKNRTSCVVERVIPILPTEQLMSADAFRSVTDNGKIHFNASLVS